VRWFKSFNVIPTKTIERNKNNVGLILRFGRVGFYLIGSYWFNDFLLAGAEKNKRRHQRGDEKHSRIEHVVLVLRQAKDRFYK